MVTEAQVCERLAVHALHTTYARSGPCSASPSAKSREHERVERACRRALDAGDGRYRTVRGILERGFDLLTAADEAPPSPREIGTFLRGPAAFAHTVEEVG